jgi:hypothetical protein
MDWAFHRMMTYLTVVALFAMAVVFALLAGPARHLAPLRGSKS